MDGFGRSGAGQRGARIKGAARAPSAAHLSVHLDGVFCAVCGAVTQLSTHTHFRAAGGFFGAELAAQRRLTVPDPRLSSAHFLAEAHDFCCFRGPCAFAPPHKHCTAQLVPLFPSRRHHSRDIMPNLSGLCAAFGGNPTGVDRPGGVGVPTASPPCRRCVVCVVCVTCVQQAQGGRQ